MIRDRIEEKLNRLKMLKNVYFKDALETFQERRNQVLKLLDDAVEARLIDDKIINDLGSSFSKLKRNGDKIKKFAIRKEGESKIIDEINWYLNCRRNMGNPAYNSFLPEIIDYSLESGNVFYTMKYYTYPSLRTLVFEYGIKKGRILKIIESVIDSLKDNVYSIKQKIATPPDYVEVAHFKNLKDRIDHAIRMRPEIKGIMRGDNIDINGKRYLNIKVLMKNILNEKKIIRSLTPPRLWVIHGDVHYNNILCSVITNRNILIDCRGRSPYGTLQCDVSVDIGKIYHEFRSYYSFIERNEYTLFVHETPKKTSIDFEFGNKEIKKVYDSLIGDIEKLLDKKFKGKEFGNWKYRAEFIEGKLYISMMPFHIEDLSEAIVCYSTGIIRLNEWMEKYHPKLYARLKKRYLA